MILGDNALIRAKAAASVAWYLASGTIDAAAVEQYGENIASNTAYTGSTIASTSTWTLAIKMTGYTPAGSEQILQTDSSSRLYVIMTTVPTIRFFSPSGSVTLSHGGTSHVYFVVNDGSNMIVYDDNTSEGTTAAGRLGDSGNFDGTKVTFDFVAVYNIPLDTTQRAALYASMTA